MIDRESQAQLAKDILQLVDNESDVASLERIYKVTATLLKLSGFEDNGIAFDLNEYTYETLESVKGARPTGWREHARQSLLSQIAETEE